MKTEMMKMAYQFVNGFEEALDTIAKIQNDASLTEKQEQQKVKITVPLLGALSQRKETEF